MVAEAIGRLSAARDAAGTWTAIGDLTDRVLPQRAVWRDDRGRSDDRGALVGPVIHWSRSQSRLRSRGRAVKEQTQRALRGLLQNINRASKHETADTERTGKREDPTEQQDHGRNSNDRQSQARGQAHGRTPLKMQPGLEGLCPPWEGARRD